MGGCALGFAATAQADVSLSTNVSARKVEVGSQFTLQLRVSASNNEQIGAPELKLPAGITASPRAARHVPTRTRAALALASAGKVPAANDSLLRRKSVDFCRQLFGAS